MREALKLKPKESVVNIDFDGLEAGLATGNIEFDTLFGDDKDTPNYLYHFRDGDRPQLSSALVTILRQIPKSKIRESHPRLTNMLSEIEKSGSLFGWEEEKFGTVYHWLPAIRPWDIKFPVLDPKMSDGEYKQKLIENMAAIRDWYGAPDMITHSDPPVIDFMGPHKGFPQHRLDNPNIDRQLLNACLEERKKRAAMNLALPDELMGIYKTRLESTKGMPNKVQVLAALQEKSLDILAIDEDGNVPNIARQLIKKFGIDPRNPVLSEFGFHLDPQDFYIVLSNNPLDILYSSTDKPWHSCYCQDASHEHGPNGQPYKFQKGPYYDIAAGSSIAYLLDGNGNFAGRSILRLGLDESEQERSGVSRLGVGVERYYGDVYFKRIATKSFATILESSGIPTQKSSQILTPPISSSIYPDNGMDIVNEDRFNPQRGYRILRYDGNE
jgi:hypothetical protein